jgi:hypothetical protein
MLDTSISISSPNLIRSAVYRYRNYLHLSGGSSCWTLPSAFPHPTSFGQLSTGRGTDFDLSGGASCLILPSAFHQPTSFSQLFTGTGFDLHLSGDTSCLILPSAFHQPTSFGQLSTGIGTITTSLEVHHAGYFHQHFLTQPHSVSYLQVYKSRATLEAFHVGYLVSCLHYRYYFSCK